MTISPSSSSAIVQSSVTGISGSRKTEKRCRKLVQQTEGEESDRECNLVKPDSYYLYTNKPFAQLVSDFFSGVGWINTTFMFYGKYSHKSPGHAEWRKDFLQHAVGLFYGGLFLLPGYSTLHHMRRISKKDFRLATLAKRTRKQTYKLYAIRIVVNLLVLGLSALSAWLIFMASQMSIKTSQDDLDIKASISSDLMHLLESYASPITLSALGSIVPSIFFLFSLGRLEPKSQSQRGFGQDGAPEVILSCSPTRFVCWENVIGAEMYKLIWTDFFVTLLVIIAVQTPQRYFADHVSLGCDLGKKVGRPAFFLPNNVLELVYGQSLIWIGTWYSPFLPLMAIVKLPLTFYAKKATVVYNCRAQEKAYRAGRSNYFFMILLLGTFLLCLAAVAYGITQIRPSELYGPFRELNEVYDIIPWTVSVLPSGLRDTFQILSSPVFLVVLGVVVCLGLYFFYAIAKVYRRMINGLREELSMESRDKKYLLQMFTNQSEEKT
ncbi:Transmembrane channel-like [Desmophyllum pertusum]|uniref:Transmembrane channel-like n=1 Tax=Desmophyllum pertusum TaxID=174260 RepID=A0A9W9ZVX1_9CNID|nr:Transmembrane channel-like [Desmophyllum pertusum]